MSPFQTVFIQKNGNLEYGNLNTHPTFAFFDDVKWRKFINENIKLIETINNTRVFKRYVNDSGDIDCFVVGR